MWPLKLHCVDSSFSAKAITTMRYKSSFDVYVPLREHASNFLKSHSFISLAVNIGYRSIHVGRPIFKVHSIAPIENTFPPSGVGASQIYGTIILIQVV